MTEIYHDHRFGTNDRLEKTHPTRFFSCNADEFQVSSKTWKKKVSEVSPRLPPKKNNMNINQQVINWFTF